MGNSLNSAKVNLPPQLLPPRELQDVEGFASFADSMALTTHHKKRHPEAVQYFNDFRAKRSELARKLFTYFNATVFGNFLPENVEIEFNFQLWRPSGAAHTLVRGDDNSRYYKIFLSVRHMEDPERLRDTLIHEMCHVAVWLLNVNPRSKDGDHGPCWQKLATHAQSVHPNIIIQKFERHATFTFYLYKCTDCGCDIGENVPREKDQRTCPKCGGVLSFIPIDDPDLKILLKRKK